MWSEIVVMAVAAIFHDVMQDSLSVLTDISENPAVSSVR
jgi:hypothetical protein